MIDSMMDKKHDVFVKEIIFSKIKFTGNKCEQKTPGRFELMIYRSKAWYFNH